jgi:hypothetical protein
MTRRFRFERHNDYGTIGLKPLWMPPDQADPLTGVGAAHDVLEHGPNDRVEWQGLGGSIYVRSEEYYNYRSSYNAAENIGSEFYSLFNLWRGPIPDPGKTCRVHEYAEDFIQSAVTCGCRTVTSEAKYSGDPEDVQRAVDWVSYEQQRRFIGWLRKGYRAACKRWHAYPQFKVLQTFIAIENAVDKALQHGEDYEGLDCVLLFSVQHETARIDIQEER